MALEPPASTMSSTFAKANRALSTGGPAGGPAGRQAHGADNADAAVYTCALGIRQEGRRRQTEVYLLNGEIGLGKDLADQA